MKTRIKSLGLNQQDLADLLGHNRVTINNRLNGKKNATITQDIISLVAFGEALKSVDPDLYGKTVNTLLADKKEGA
ncbi:helix-turn-helix domain-containing protein [Candidatus Terasakiella magnetica]|nr:helix-turn-helix domain-containing protein [Candidatus Terasakiella magnetica]